MIQEHNSKIYIPLIGLGTYSQFNETLNHSITTAISNGVLLIDTAYKYQNERDIANVIKGVPRNQLFIQSKVCARQLLGRLSRLRLDKQSIRKAYHTSCRNLGVKYLDSYLIHSYFCGAEKHYNKLMYLRNNGLVPIIGFCNVNIDQIKSIYNACGEYPMTIQVEIHPYHSQKQLIEFCNEHNIKVQARSPFAHGDVLNEWMEHDTIKKIAIEHGKSVPQIILRWLTQQGVTPIFRSRREEHIVANANIFTFELTQNQMHTIDSLNKNLSFGYISNKANRI